MIRQPPRSTLDRSSAASDVYKRQVRIVKERQGLYRYPEPKILAGSNYADVGFELDPATGRVVVLLSLIHISEPTRPY